MFWNPGHQKSSEVADQVISCVVLDPRLWCDVIPTQGLHTWACTLTSPGPSPSHSQIHPQPITGDHGGWDPSAAATTESWAAIAIRMNYGCLGSSVPPQGQNQMNKDFLKELFDLDSGKYFKTKSYKGSWFSLFFLKGLGSYSFPQKVLGRLQARTSVLSGGATGWWILYN